MSVNIFGRLSRGAIDSSIDADLLALVKSGAPGNSDRVTGQQRLCIDTTNKAIYYHDGGASTAWDRIDEGNLVVAASAPASPSEGQGWYDTANNQLKFYDGSAWQAIGGLQVATDAEFVTGTATTKAPNVKQVRDFGRSASSLAVQWNGHDDLVTAGLASLAPYSEGSNNARSSSTYYDATNDRWQLMRPNTASGTGAKVGNLIFEDAFFNFNQMVMSFNLTMGRQTGADNNSFVDMFWGAESDALNNSGDVWGGTNTKGMFVRCKRHSTNNTVVFWIGVNDSAIRTGVGSNQFGNTRFYLNSTARWTFSDIASASGTYAVEVDVPTTNTSEVEITFAVLGNVLTLYVNGKFALDLDLGFSQGVGNTYTWGPRYGIMGDDGSGVPSAMFAYMNGLLLGTPDPLNASTRTRPPAILVNPSPSADAVATKMEWDGTTYRFGVGWADITGKPSDLAEIPLSATAPASPSAGDLWADNGGAGIVLRIYDGSAWISVDASGPAADNSIPAIGLFDHVHGGEWYRYGAATPGAPTANPGVMVVEGTAATALDLATGKTYTSTVGTALGDWSTAADASLSSEDYTTATADTVYSISSTDTGWPSAATAAGVDGAVGTKTVVGSVTWGICIVRNGLTVDAYTKNGSAAWALAGLTDRIVVTHWTDVPVGKVRIMDLWAKQIVKRTTTAEQRWYYAVNDNGLFSGAAQYQTRTQQSVTDWRSAAPMDVRGAPPGGAYTAVATATAVDSAGDVHYDATTRTLKIWPKAGDEAYWDGALQNRARIWAKDSTSLGDLVYGVSTGHTWSGGAVSCVLSQVDLVYSTALTTGNTYAFTAMGLWVTWGDYAVEPLALTPSLFNNLNVGDVNRYETGTPDAPNSQKRGLAWRVGDRSIVVYDEDNVQWNIAKVPVTTFGTWSARTAPSAVSNIDATTTAGLYRADSGSTGTRPADTAKDFYFAVLGSGQWKYQIGWVKHQEVAAFAGYTVTTEIAFNAAGEMFVHAGGSNTSRTVDVFPVANQNTELLADLAVNNSLEVRNATSPTEYFSGDISAVADHPTVTGAKRVTLINGAHSGEITIGDTVRISTYRSSGLLFRARQNVASGSGWTFSGVPWSYSVVDLRLYFGTTDLSDEEQVGRTRAFEATVLNEPSAQSGKPGLTVFDSATGKQIAVFISTTANANDAPSFALQERTYSTVSKFLQANWHNVPGLDTTSIGYDFVLSRTLVTGQHPGPGELHLNRTTSTFVINVQEKIGSHLTASYAMSRLVKGTIVQLEQPSNGRRWTAEINRVERYGGLGHVHCTLLNDRGSDQFYVGSEIKLFAQGYGTGELPTVSNLNAITDAVMGQTLQYRHAATGNPFPTEDGRVWISSEHGGEFYRKYQRVASNQSLGTAQRYETLTAGVWSSALSPGDDLVTGAATFNCNNAALDHVTIVPATATNKPGTAAGLIHAWKRTDTTIAQVYITPTTIHWRVTTVATPTTFGSWASTTPDDTVMARVPDTTNGILDPYPINAWRWLVESSNLTGVPSLPETAHYAFTRIVRGSTENQFTNELYYYVTANNEAQKVTSTVTEGWSAWQYGYEKPLVKQATSALIFGNTNEGSFENITFTPRPNTKYMVTAHMEGSMQLSQSSESQSTTFTGRIRENSGSNTGVNGTSRASTAVNTNYVQITGPRWSAFSTEVVYIFTAGASPSAMTLHATGKVSRYNTNVSDNQVSSGYIRVEMIQ